MSYDSRKVLRDQEFVEELNIYFNACRYSVDPFGNQNIFVKTGSDSHSAGSSGFELHSDNPNFTAWYATWSGYPMSRLYAEVGTDGEIIKCDIVDANTIFVTGRGKFGTTAATISGTQPIRFMHIGEADGSCRGFSQTCSEPLSYEENTFKILRLCNSPRTAGAIMFPGLRHGAIDYDSAEVDVGESIGSPAKLKFDLQDIVHDDKNWVPYPSRRSSSGTFWGKNLARNPYMNGRKVVYKSGLRDSGKFTDPEFIERHFIIDSFSLSDGKFSCSCLDPIILTEDKKAKMPVVSPAQLSAPIAGNPSTFIFVNAGSYYFGMMGATIFVRIDSEIIKATVSGADQLTVVQRGYRSEAKDHEAGATIQDCVVFAGTHVIDAITYALENFTQMPSSYIGDYSTVKALIPTVDMDEAIISKPMATADFISSMIKFGNLIFYFDESALKIVIDYIPELSIESININEREHILRGSISVNENTKEQWTRFAHLWAPVDVTKDTEENFAISYLAANLAVESPAMLGEVNEKKPFKDPLLSSSAGDSLIGAAYTSRVVSGADRAPRIVNAVINAGSIGNTQSGNLKLGSIINLVTKENQGIDGTPIAELFQVLKMSGNAYENFNVKMRRYLSVQPAAVDFVITTGGVNYDLSGHFAPAAGAYTVYIEQGVEFGSYDTAIPAFTTGSQAAGVSFNIVHRGSILGMGGAGGDAGRLGTLYDVGDTGGIAFEATVPCTIDAGSGLIWAGGGGGNGEYYIYPQGPNSFKVPRSGGGGGQGFGTSLGGRNTNGENFTSRAQSGNQSSPGTSNCPDGGAWGESGEPITNPSTGAPIAGGLAGIAIKSNGNSVIVSAGNNDFNIRGRRT